MTAGFGDMNTRTILMVLACTIVFVRFRGSIARVVGMVPIVNRLAGVGGK